MPRKKHRGELPEEVLARRQVNESALVFKLIPTTIWMPNLVKRQIVNVDFEVSG
jgi:hypothetical protein